MDIFHSYIFRADRRCKHCSQEHICSTESDSINQVTQRVWTMLRFYWKAATTVLQLLLMGCRLSGSDWVGHGSRTGVLPTEGLHSLWKWHGKVFLSGKYSSFIKCLRTCLFTDCKSDKFVKTFVTCRMKSRTKQPVLGALLQELFHVRLLSVALNEYPGMVTAIKEQTGAVMLYWIWTGMYLSAFHWKIACR